MFLAIVNQMTHCKKKTYLNMHPQLINMDL
jgi:hypothetical protein